MISKVPTNPTYSKFCASAQGGCFQEGGFNQQGFKLHFLWKLDQDISGVLLDCHLPSPPRRLSSIKSDRPNEPEQTKEQGQKCIMQRRKEILIQRSF